MLSDLQGKCSIIYKNLFFPLWEITNCFLDGKLSRVRDAVFKTKACKTVWRIKHSTIRKYTISIIRVTEKFSREIFQPLPTAGE